MQERHGSRHDGPTAGRETAALYEIKSFAKFFYEFRDFTEVITFVRVAHDNELALCGRDTAHQSTAISFRFNMNDLYSEPLRNCQRTISAAVVCHNDFAADVVVVQCAPGSFDARFEGIR